MTPIAHASRDTRALVLAPGGRDGTLILQLLAETGLHGEAVADVPALVAAMQEDCGLVIVLEESLRQADLRPLQASLAAQPPWSDLPFLVLTQISASRQLPNRQQDWEALLGNVSLVERPLHPQVLTSAARAAVRARNRQYQARAHLAEIASRAQVLESNERRLRNIADNIPALCWMAGPDGFISWYNRRWYEYTGTEPADMQGWGWQSVHDPAVLPLVMERWAHSIASGEFFEMTFPLRGRDGQFRAFLTRIAPLRDEHGAIQFWFGTNVDISEQLLAQEALNERETQLRFALEAGRLGAWEYDIASGEMRCSAQCKANYGHPPDAVFGYADLLDAIVDSDRPGMRAAVEISVRYNMPYETEYRVCWPDDTLHWIEARGRVVARKDGSRLLSGTTADITERKHAEAQILQTNELLERLVRDRTAELEIAQQEWRNTEEQLRQAQKMEAIGQLTGGIAHDFNNLLTGIMGSLEMLERRLADGRHADLPRFISTARMSARTAATLTHRLLAFSRRQSLDPQPVDINALILSFDEVFQRALGEGLRYDKRLAADLQLACVDANQLENALLNLVINARDATPRGGTVRIVTENLRLAEGASTPDSLAAGDYICVAVEDTGSGMPPEVIRRVFEPFFTTKPIGQGSGLGLAMVYGFVRQSGGQVRIASTVGEGTAIRLVFPRVDLPAQAAAVSPHSGLPLNKGSGHILLVEDDVGVRALLTELLEGIGYRLTQAASGSEALPVIRSGVPIDLLLSDVGLPGMSGRELADLARVERPALKVLFMTGYASTALTRETFLAPGMDMLIKPFELESIVRKIQTMLAD